MYLMVIPPFSVAWIEQMESIGAVPATSGLKERLADLPADVARKVGWETLSEIEETAHTMGAAGVVLMGLRFSSLVEEAADAWSPALTQTDKASSS